MIHHLTLKRIIPHLLPVQDAVSVSYLFSVSPCAVLQGLHLPLQPLSFGLVLLCLQTPFRPLSGQLLTARCTSVRDEEAYSCTRCVTRRMDSNGITGLMKHIAAYLALRPDR